MSNLTPNSFTVFKVIETPGRGSLEAGNLGYFLRNFSIMIGSKSLLSTRHADTI